ncbi:hypothetical protein L198_07413 [Cryptococcus wingfieldii CBS 7118]|uniref:Uncharacterized protein n=1 Tax=Cryptococcus wingfieldii CBS 7118 TaxID=1295528 RepID=A0A1E3IB61_9TREE|nr:hypothetical protein L198_07413 [Cryptococcus wingfieldii CBS 7118]ODN85850.1 hypothetical protein L198_07413 [Cryptococcus wingfieldii CBS 7118]
MAHAGPSSRTGGSTAVPQPVNQTPASMNPMPEIFRSICDVNAYPSDIGHPANGGLGGPLQLVPFDLTISHHYPNSFTIKPYSTVDQRAMGSFWIECYPDIATEYGLQNKHIVPYLRQFYVHHDFVQYPTSWETNVYFCPTPFYLHLGAEFVDLPIVRSIRENDTELKVRSLACAPYIVADQLLQRLERSSQVASLLSRKLDGIKPDVALTGYHIGNLAEGTYQKEPADGRQLTYTDDPQEVLYALIKDKWLPWPGASNIDLKGKIDLHLKGLQFANMEAITQTVYYSELGYTLSKCRSAIALANGDYTRIVNLSDLPTEGEEAALEGVTLGGGGGRRILVEADPAVVAKLRYHRLDCLSPHQFGTLAAGEPLFGIQWKAPNSLIANYEDWSLDQEAKDRLDATVYLNLALATHHPEAVQDPPISNDSLTHVIDANASEKEAYQLLGVSKKMGAHRDQVEEEEDEEENDDHEGNEENDKQAGDRRDEDNGNPDGETGGPGGGAPGPGNGDPGPGSGDPAPSGGRSSRPRSRSDHNQDSSSKRQKKADVSGLPPTPNALSCTTAEQVLPLEHWTHAEYIDYFSGLGLTFVLATPMEVDVLLARAAKFGWIGALGSR